MPLAERDLLRRLIQDLGRLLAVICGLREAGKLEEADQELSAAIGSLLGRLARDAEQLDSRSLAAMLPAERVHAYARLLEERAALHEARLNPELARIDRERARELSDELRARGSKSHI